MVRKIAFDYELGFGVKLRYKGIIKHTHTHTHIDAEGWVAFKHRVND